MNVRPADSEAGGLLFMVQSIDADVESVPSLVLLCRVKTEALVYVLVYECARPHNSPTHPAMAILRETDYANVQKVHNKNKEIWGKMIGSSDIPRDRLTKYRFLLKF